MLILTQGTKVIPQRNGDSGVFVTGDSLVLQKVTRGVSGRYSCKATNTLGSHTSNFVPLDVLCKFCLQCIQVSHVREGVSYLKYSRKIPNLCFLKLQTFTCYLRFSIE